MFRQLPKRLFLANGTTPVFNFADPEDNARGVLRTHPLELAAYLEAFWAGGPTVRKPGNNTNPPLGHPNFLSEEPATTRVPLRDGQILLGVDNDETGRRRLRWDHLIYAYMIENTRLYEIFRRVVYEYRHGEKLGTPIDADTQHWFRATEELFYSDPAPFFITNVSSHIRSDLRASRRNAYQRMFGMDLNHGTDAGQPYPYVKAEAANAEFVNTFEEFLREVWIGITNVNNSSGPDPTDNSKISELAEKLHDMLQSRRESGNLAREEFAFVSMMAWFHLTLEFDSPIVKSLRAEAVGPENRLFKIAERVGLPAHGLAKHFFDIADPMSRLLIQIELDTYSDIQAVPALYEPFDAGGQANPVESDMRTISTHWAAITGRDVKARKVATN
jgi:hypothetical protein